MLHPKAPFFVCFPFLPLSPPHYSVCLAVLHGRFEIALHGADRSCSEIYRSPWFYVVSICLLRPAPFSLFLLLISEDGDLIKTRPWENPSLRPEINKDGQRERQRQKSQKKGIYFWAARPWLFG